MRFLASSNHVDFENPLLWAVMIGWIFTVVLHEFAHGLVAYWGGDYSIRDRGGLTLNPLQYIDPVMSILLPAVFLIMGGIPLPGGSTYIRRDLLRNKYWDMAVSAAGPAANFLIFLVLGLLLSPRLGWVAAGSSVDDWSNAQKFVGALASLQVIAMVINLIPIPPLDGYGIIRPLLPVEIQQRLADPLLADMLLAVFFLAIWRVPEVFDVIMNICFHIETRLGFDPFTLYRAYFRCMCG